MLSDEVQKAGRAAMKAGAKRLAEFYKNYPEASEEPGFATSLLKLAVRYDNPNLLEILVQNGGDIHDPITPGQPEGLIDRAVMREATRCVKYLLENGATVSHTVGGTRRCLSLFTAVIDGNIEIIKLLIGHGANVNDTWNGENALGFALQYEHTEIADYLRSLGAKTPDELGLAWSDDDEPAAADSLLVHIEEHLGTPRPVSVMEPVPGEPPITLHIIDLPDERQQVLVTEGMSSLPMSVPDGGEEYQYAELVLRLSQDWPLDEESLRDPRFLWPLGWLRQIARYTHDNQTWLGGQHSVISNEEPPEPLGPGTKLTCLLVVESFESYGRWERADGESVVFYDVIPIYTEERDYEAAHGLAALMEKFDGYGISRWLQPDRVNTAAKPPGNETDSEHQQSSKVKKKSKPLSEQAMAGRILNKVKKVPVDPRWAVVGDPLVDSRVDMNNLPESIGRPLILAFRDDDCWSVIGTGGVTGVYASERATVSGSQFIDAEPEGWGESGSKNYEILILRTETGDHRYWFPAEDFEIFWNIINIFGI